MAKILIVEDDQALSEVLRSALTESGHEVLEAPDGTVASRILRTESLDLVIADIFLPEKDGLEVIREIKRVTPNVKVIAISGGGRLSKNTYLKAAMAFGADRRLDKPFMVKELTDSVEELLSS